MGSTASPFRQEPRQQTEAANVGHRVRGPGQQGSRRRAEGRVEMRSNQKSGVPRTPGREGGNKSLETGWRSQHPDAGGPGGGEWSRRDWKTFCKATGWVPHPGRRAEQDSPPGPDPARPWLLTVLQELPDGRCSRSRAQSPTASHSNAAVATFHVGRCRGDGVSSGPAPPGWWRRIWAPPAPPRSRLPAGLVHRLGCGGCADSGRELSGSRGGRAPRAQRSGEALAAGPALPSVSRRPPGTGALPRAEEKVGSGTWPPRFSLKQVFNPRIGTSRWTQERRAEVAGLLACPPQAQRVGVSS